MAYSYLVKVNMLDAAIANIAEVIMLSAAEGIGLSFIFAHCLSSPCFPTVSEFTPAVYAVKQKALRVLALSQSSQL
jgi:hypothetical protein